MKCGWSKREKARVGIVKSQTVFLFPKAEQGNGLAHAETAPPLLVNWLAERPGKILDQFELLERSFRVSALGERFGEAVSQVHLLHGVRASFDHRCEKLDALLTQEAEFYWVE